VRLFVAFDLPEDARQWLRGLVAKLMPLVRGARWIRPEGMHITLKFIGQVGPHKLDLIRAALTPIRSAQPAEMQFRRLGFFPTEIRPRVVWCGVEASSNVAQLARDVEQALQPLGIAPESRPFVPHLTLARLQSSICPEELARAASEHESKGFGSAWETEFHLYESTLTRSGAEYTCLQSYPFLKGAA